ncbi:transcription repressor OFP8-like [Phalaenopsis equestris]|uniref:transcription repressor OFP8-like n=1 Tax=Phalaenopsis equestris TaxID=78828 RepID=UPI0009E22DCF|nr:transcription repressor OFP8-like [Phalaenopsis equestris]
MSSGRRRFSMKQPAPDVGGACRRGNLSSFLTSLRLKPRRPNTPHSLSSSSLWPSTATSSTMANSSSFSLSSHDEQEKKKKKKKNKEQSCDKRIRNRGMGNIPWSAEAESVPVVKESSEPYADFRESMVQMIVENDLYAWDELNDLLHRFLSLNSPRHHNLILHAFADLWSGVFSPPSPCRWDNHY